jgi:hypothetical protein
MHFIDAGLFLGNSREGIEQKKNAGPRF